MTMPATRDIVLKVLGHAQALLAKSNGFDVFPKDDHEGLATRCAEEIGQAPAGDLPGALHDWLMAEARRRRAAHRESL